MKEFNPMNNIAINPSLALTLDADLILGDVV